MDNIRSFFHQSFDVLTDYSQRVLDEALRLRYQVYCLETGFENHSAFLDGRERDRFDPHSLHGVIKSRQCGLNIGTVRLVKPIHEGARIGFPLEARYPDLLSDHGLGDKALPPHSTAEISRFCISKHFRRLSTATISRRCPMVTFGLFLALVRLSAMYQLTHWIAVMEPCLLRLLARFGIRFTPIGGLVHYHGWRQPCYGPIDGVLSGIHDVRFDLWDLITDSGAAHPKASTGVIASRHADNAAASMTTTGR